VAGIVQLDPVKVSFWFAPPLTLMKNARVPDSA